MICIAYVWQRHRTASPVMINKMWMECYMVFCTQKVQHKKLLLSLWIKFVTHKVSTICVYSLFVHWLYSNSYIVSMSGNKFGDPLTNFLNVILGISDWAEKSEWFETTHENEDDMIFNSLLRRYTTLCRDDMDFDTRYILINVTSGQIHLIIV